MKEYIASPSPFSKSNGLSAPQSSRLASSSCLLTTSPQSPRHTGRTYGRRDLLIQQPMTDTYEVIDEPHADETAHVQPENLHGTNGTALDQDGWDFKPIMNYKSDSFNKADDMSRSGALVALGAHRSSLLSFFSGLRIKVFKTTLLSWLISYYIWVSLIVMACLTVLGVELVVYYAGLVRVGNVNSATSIASASARELEKLLGNQKGPILTTATTIYQNPHWPTVRDNFNSLATTISKLYTFYELEADPYGLIASMYLPWAASQNLTGNNLTQYMVDNLDFGKDILNPYNRPNYWAPWGEDVGSVSQNGSIFLIGPWQGHGVDLLFTLRYSIFLNISNDTEWNALEMPEGTTGIIACPEVLCRTPTGGRFWGLINAIFTWDTIFPGLNPVLSSGLLYTLTPDIRSPNQSYLALSNPPAPRAQASCVDVNVLSWLSWTLCVCPVNGWDPQWKGGATAAVVIIAFIVSLLVGLVLRSKHQAVLYLRQQKESNKQLMAARETQNALLSGIFPRHVVEFLSKTNSNDLIARPLSDVARSHREVTILFMDIAGFTAMCKAVSAEAILIFLNELFSMFDYLVEYHNIMKVETIGDCYIVAGGIMEIDSQGFYQMTDHSDPVDDASRVLAFAKDMLRCSKEVRMPHNNEVVDIRIGIHTGDCVTGLVGTKLPKFSIYGDTMNTASRMESTGTVGTIHISASTHKLLSQQLSDGMSYSCDDQWLSSGGVEVKGKGVMETYVWKMPEGFLDQPLPEGALKSALSCGSPSGPQVTALLTAHDGVHVDALDLTAHDGGSAASGRAGQMQGEAAVTTSTASGEAAAATLDLLDKLMMPSQSSLVMMQDDGRGLAAGGGRGSNPDHHDSRKLPPGGPHSRSNPDHHDSGKLPPGGPHESNPDHHDSGKPPPGGPHRSNPDHHDSGKLPPGGPHGSNPDHHDSGNKLPPGGPHRSNPDHHDSGKPPPGGPHGSNPDHNSSKYHNHSSSAWNASVTGSGASPPDSHSHRTSTPTRRIQINSALLTMCQQSASSWAASSTGISASGSKAPASPPFSPARRAAVAAGRLSEFSRHSAAAAAAAAACSAAAIKYKKSEGGGVHNKATEFKRGVALDDEGTRIAAAPLWRTLYSAGSHADAHVQESYLRSKHHSTGGDVHQGLIISSTQLSGLHVTESDAIIQIERPAQPPYPASLENAGSCGEAGSHDTTKEEEPKLSNQSNQSRVLNKMCGNDENVGNPLVSKLSLRKSFSMGRLHSEYSEVEAAMAWADDA